MRTSKNAPAIRPKAPPTVLPTDMERPLEEFSDPNSSMESTTGVARQNMVAEAAYYRAERRGFEPGHELDDWLAAEGEITAASLQRNTISGDMR